MRNKEAREDILANGRDISTGTYSMPTVAAGKVMNEIEKESDFRKIATVIRAYKNGYRIFAKDCKDKAEFVAEGAAIPVYDSAGDFNEKTIESYKLASIVTLDEDFVNDAGFDIEKYLTQKLGKSFGKAEDNAFINGTGADEPTGILHNTDGAETALAVETLTYDDVMPDFDVTIVYEGNIETGYSRSDASVVNESGESMQASFPADSLYYEQDGMVVTLGNWLNGRLSCEQIEQLWCELIIPEQNKEQKESEE